MSKTWVIDEILTLIFEDPDTETTDSYESGNMPLPKTLARTKKDTATLPTT